MYKLHHYLKNRPRGPHLHSTMIARDPQNQTLNTDLSFIKYRTLSLTWLSSDTHFHWLAWKRHLFFNDCGNFRDSCHHWLFYSMLSSHSPDSVIAVNSGVITVFIGDIGLPEFTRLVWSCASWESILFDKKPSILLSIHLHGLSDKNNINPMYKWHPQLLKWKLVQRNATYTRVNTVIPWVVSKYFQ